MLVLSVVLVLAIEPLRAEKLVRIVDRVRIAGATVRRAIAVLLVANEAGSGGKYSSRGGRRVKAGRSLVGSSL